MKEKRKTFADEEIKAMIEFYRQSSIDSPSLRDTMAMLEELLILREQVRKYA